VVWSSLAQAQESVDAILEGGPIDDKNPTAEAPGVLDGKIVAVGLKEDVLKLRGAQVLGYRPGWQEVNSYTVSTVKLPQVPRNSDNDF